jgi:cytoskeletal protein CcmA (bactofilin family)
MANIVNNNGNPTHKEKCIPILIPEESILEGFIKTKKSFRIESYFFGTLISTQKVLIDINSIVCGDIICAELFISGVFEGNIFCTGKVECNGNAKITGNIYTKLFQNEDTCDLNCIIQVPKNDVFLKIRELLLNVDATTKLSTDSTLTKIIELFSKNVYSNLNSGIENKAIVHKGKYAIPEEFEPKGQIIKN